MSGVRLARFFCQVTWLRFSRLKYDSPSTASEKLFRLSVELLRDL